jgi:hypothetical protein
MELEAALAPAPSDGDWKNGFTVSSPGPLAMLIAPA